MKYSVIIPVYNAENTLRRCVDSLLAEQYPDAEIILVNDGSKDRSSEICKAYAAEHDFICYLEKENGGVSTARNLGLDKSSGTYIVFVDSDDYVVSNFFHILDERMAQAPADLIQFSFIKFDGKEKTEHPFVPLSASSREHLMPHIVNAICRKTINGPIAKIYRRDLIESWHIRFPVGVSVAEDRAFNIKYSMHIASYSVSERVVYVVSTENENSLSRGRHADLKQQFDITGQYFLDALREAPIPEWEKGQYRQAVDFGTCRSIYHDAKRMHRDHVNWLQRQTQIGKLCDTINRRHMKYPKTYYCILITLPVRLRLTPVIDAIAWKLAH